jgi:hypothetical protein
VSATTQTSKITWTDAAGANSYNVYKGKNGVYGFIGRAGDGTTGFTDTTVAPDTSDTPPEDKNPFDATDKFPGCSTYHEGRQWYARTNGKPQTLWSSASAAFNNMNTSSPSKDSDAITRTIASREVNEIRHLLSLKRAAGLDLGRGVEGMGRGAGRRDDARQLRGEAAVLRGACPTCRRSGRKAARSTSRPRARRCATWPTSSRPTASRGATSRSSPATCSRG